MEAAHFEFSLLPTQNTVGVLLLLLCTHMQLISRHKLDRSVCGAWSGRLGVRETENKSRLDRAFPGHARHEAANPC